MKTNILTLTEKERADAVLDFLDAAKEFINAAYWVSPSGYDNFDSVDALLVRACNIVRKSYESIEHLYETNSPFDELDNRIPDEPCFNIRNANDSFLEVFDKLKKYMVLK